MLRPLMMVVSLLTSELSEYRGFADDEVCS